MVWAASMTIQPLTKPTRQRDEDYLAFVRALSCCVQTTYCEGSIDPHHVVPAGGGKVGSKVDDNRTIPLCRYHHDEYHRTGRHLFEHDYAIDLEAEILKLQRAYRPTVRRERVTRSAKLSITGTCVKGHETKLPLVKLFRGSHSSEASFYCVQCACMVEVG